MKSRVSRDGSDWRCRGCGNLLGVAFGERLQIKIGQRYQYWVALPASCVCSMSNCGTLNELNTPPPNETPRDVSPRRR